MSSLLVPFGGSADGVRHLLIHPAGGGVMPYLPLGMHLAPRGPVTAIRAAGLLPGEQPDATVVEAAARYADLVEAAGLRPDLLLGWSMGGVLAWEVAARLHERGLPPGAVVMIDSSCAVRAELGDDEAERLALWVETDGLNGGATGTEQERATVRAHVRANVLHRVESSQVAPTLLLACGDHPVADRLGDWTRVGDERLCVERIPGEHFDVFTPAVLPHVTEAVDRFLSGVLPTTGARR